MDIQIGWQVYRSVGRHVHWPEYDVYVSTCRTPLINLHSGLFIYEHVKGHAGLISGRTSVKAMYGVCICYGGMGGGLFPQRH